MDPDPNVGTPLVWTSPSQRDQCYPSFRKKNLFSVSHWKIICNLGLMQVSGLGPQSLTPDWLPNHHHLSQYSWLIAHNTSNMSSHCPSAWKMTASMLFHQQHTCSPSESQLKYDLSWRRLHGVPKAILLTEMGLASLSHRNLTFLGSLPRSLSHLFPTFLTRAWVLGRKKCIFFRFCSFITRLASWLINACRKNINGGGGFKKWAGTE